MEICELDENRNFLLMAERLERSQTFEKIVEKPPVAPNGLTRTGRFLQASDPHIRME